MLEQREGEKGVRMVGRGLPQARGGRKGWRAGRQGGKDEEAAVTSIPGPEEASPPAVSPLRLEPPTLWDLASKHLTPSSPAPYL